MRTLSTRRAIRIAVVLGAASAGCPPPTQHMDVVLPTAEAGPVSPGIRGIDRPSAQCDRVELHLSVDNGAYVTGLPATAFSYQVRSLAADAGPMRAVQNECFAEVTPDAGRRYYKVCVSGLTTLTEYYLTATAQVDPDTALTGSVFFMTTFLCPPRDAGVDAPADTSPPDAPPDAPVDVTTVDAAMDSTGPDS